MSDRSLTLLFVFPFVDEISTFVDEIDTLVDLFCFLSFVGVCLWYQ